MKLFTIVTVLCALGLAGVRGDAVSCSQIDYLYYSSDCCDNSNTVECMESITQADKAAIDSLANLERADATACQEGDAIHFSANGIVCAPAAAGDSGAAEAATTTQAAVAATTTQAALVGEGGACGWNGPNCVLQFQCITVDSPGACDNNDAETYGGGCTCQDPAVLSQSGDSCGALGESACGNDAGCMWLTSSGMCVTGGGGAGPSAIPADGACTPTDTCDGSNQCITDAQPKSACAGDSCTCQDPAVIVTITAGEVGQCWTKDPYSSNVGTHDTIEKCYSACVQSNFTTTAIQYRAYDGVCICMNRPCTTTPDSAGTGADYKQYSITTVADRIETCSGLMSGPCQAADDCHVIDDVCKPRPVEGISCEVELDCSGPLLGETLWCNDGQCSTTNPNAEVFISCTGTDTTPCTGMINPQCFKNGWPCTDTDVGCACFDLGEDEEEEESFADGVIGGACEAGATVEEMCSEGKCSTATGPDEWGDCDIDPSTYPDPEARKTAAAEFGCSCQNQ